MPKVYIPFIETDNSISVYADEVRIFPKSHLLYSEIVRAVKGGDLTAFNRLISQSEVKGLQIQGDVITYNGQALHNMATERLFKMKAEGYDITPMVKFLENCFKNPFPAVVDKLYDFLSSRGMPITEDGCFLGYKYCNLDYWDSHTGRTVQYIPQTTVSVPVEDLCDLSGEECSNKGLHVGNQAYSGVRPRVNNNRRFLIVKVNPKDVLSVPHGSSAQKIRVWSMFVVKEITQEAEMPTQQVVDEDGDALTLQIGQSLNCVYLNGDGKEMDFCGYIKNVGDMYLELDAGWTSNNTAVMTGYTKSGASQTSKIRLKIDNIIETW